MNNKECVGGFGIGFLVGVAAGLAVGILYAPHSGKVTRGLIEERVHDARHKADKLLEEARDKTEEIIDKRKLP